MNPGCEHWNTVKWIIKYLRNNDNFSLYYDSADLECVGYADANFAGDRDRRKSTTGYVFFIGGDAIS